MTMAKRKEEETPKTEPPRKRRRYESPLRQRRAAETRNRIIAAGADLLHGFPVWNWRALTVRAVARRAGVNERTVYRHFTNERELREAVLARQQQEARVEIEKLSLDNLRDMTSKIFEHVSAFPIEPRTVLDPTLRAAGKRHRALLLSAVSEAAPDWSDADRRVVAAMLDVLWSITSYERLVADWELDPKEAARGVTWVIKLIEDVVRTGGGPKP